MRLNDTNHHNIDRASRIRKKKYILCNFIISYRLSNRYLNNLLIEKLKFIKTRERKLPARYWSEVSVYSIVNSMDGWRREKLWLSSMIPSATSDDFKENILQRSKAMK